MTISNSTVAGNSVKGTFPPCSLNHQCLTFGGGISNAGKMIISNSTVASNLSSSTSGGNVANGGGIYNAGGSLMITNSTFDGNSVENGNGGGIMTSGGSVALQNSIVANSTTNGTSGGNCNGAITSHGYNLSSDRNCSFNGPDDMNNTNPMLGYLGNYGGPTPTIPLLPGSPAIDAGNPGGCTDGSGHLLTTDQRGFHVTTRKTRPAAIWERMKARAISPPISTGDGDWWCAHYHSQRYDVGSQRFQSTAGLFACDFKHASGAGSHRLHHSALSLCP